MTGGVSTSGSLTPSQSRGTATPHVDDAPDSDVPAPLRLSRMRSLIADRGFVSVRELSERFGVSTVTVRTDLVTLAEQQLVRRVHGGAMAPTVNAVERSFEEVAGDLAEEKDVIGRAAAELVEPGEAVVIDVGTSTTAMAAHLVRREELSDVTVFTNGIKVALALEAAHPRISVVVTGGTLRPRQHSLVNPMAQQLLEGVHTTSAFLGCNGVHAVTGCTNINLPEAEVKRTMARSARRRVVLADSSKLGVTTVAPVLEPSEIDVLITDDRADMDMLAEFRSQGIDVVVAS